MAVSRDFQTGPNCRSLALFEKTVFSFGALEASRVGEPGAHTGCVEVSRMH